MTSTFFTKSSGEKYGESKGYGVKTKYFVNIFLKGLQHVATNWLRDTLYIVIQGHFDIMGNIASSPTSFENISE